MTHEEILKQAKDALDKAIDQKKSNEMLLKSIGPAVIDALKPVLNQIKEAVSSIRVDVRPNIEVNPKVDMPRIPAPEVTVNVPDFPKIPEPKVTVNVPPIKIPDLQWPKEKMPIEGWVQLMGVSLQNPLPVQIRDASGKPIDFGGSITQILGGGSGGKTDFFTIKGFSQSAFAEYVNADGRLKVSVETGGAGLTDTELRASSIPVAQVSGASWSTEATIIGITGIVSTVNSSSALLGISGVFTGTSEDVKDYGSIIIAAKSDVASATNGLSIQFSTDGTNWDHIDTHTIPAATSHTLTIAPQARYFRVVYTNGGIAQASFRLQVIFRSTAVGPQMETLSGDVSDTNFALTTRAVLAAKKPNGDYTNVQATAGGNLKVSIEESTSTLDVRQVSGAIDSVYVTGFGASVAASLIDSSGVGYSGSNPLPITVISGALTSTISVGATLHDAVDDGDAPLKIGGIARQTNPTAVADGDRVSASFDDLGRQIVRHQVRDLTQSAYATLTTGTETTLLAGVASTFLDLMWIVGANNSDVAVSVDIRSGTGGSPLLTLQIPANGTAGISATLPIKQEVIAGTWTADMADITGTTVTISALFSKEV